MYNIDNIQNRMNSKLIKACGSWNGGNLALDIFYDVSRAANLLPGEDVPERLICNKMSYRKLFSLDEERKPFINNIIEKVFMWIIPHEEPWYSFIIREISNHVITICNEKLFNDHVFLVSNNNNVVVIDIT